MPKSSVPLSGVKISYNAIFTFQRTAVKCAILISHININASKGGGY